VRFCLACGTGLAQRCRRCGAELPPAANFCSGCGQAVEAAAAPATYTPQHLAAQILRSKAALEGERKRVTVLFADIKDSMELVSERDPEAARAVLDPVLRFMMDAVHQYEGTVNQVMGDGIMALFGVPLAHEDHAVRACYAALRMQETVQAWGETMRATLGTLVRIRVGLNSGEVVVRAIGSDLRMDYTAIGQTTHLAARMEQLATPGTIVLTADTLALAEGFLQTEPRGPMSVKGLHAPVEVHELVGVTAVRSRLQAAARRGLSRLVSRTAELAELERALDRAAAGQGQLVAAVGEAGVGKSRLFYDFLHAPRTQGWRILETAALSYGKTTSYLPVIDLLRRWFGVSERDGPAEMRAKVTAAVTALGPDLAAALPALLALLEVAPDDPGWSALDPAARRQRIQEAVKRLFLAQARAEPLVLLVEDLQWADGETQAVLDGLVEDLATSRLLLLVTYRPEYTHGWAGRSWYTQLRLDTLPPASAAELLGELLGDDPSLDALKALLTERTGGNPLFLEESVRTLVETGVLGGERGAHELLRPVESIRVPDTVQAILASRIDRQSAEDKQLLQAAAVVGKDVSYALLAAIADEAPATLPRRLANLQAADFLYEVTPFPELAYTFKHALTHDVAYESVLHGRRRALHAKILDVIEHLDPERAATQLDRLAHHAFRAEAWEKAARYCREAAARAFARSAHAEALDRVEQALEALDRLGESPERVAAKRELVTQRAAALRALRGYAAAEVEAVYEKTRDLFRGAGGTAEQFAVEWQQMQFYLVKGDIDATRDLAARLLHHAELRQEPTLLMDAHLATGMALFHRGEFARARDHLERGVALYRPGSDGPHLTTHGQDPGAFCLSYLAYTLWFLGHPDRARAEAARAVEIARGLTHAFSHVSALTFQARVYECRRDLAEAAAVARQVIAAAREHGFAYYEAQGLIHLGWARAMAGGDEAGCAQIFEGYAALERTGTVLGLRGVLVQMAEAYRHVGRLDRARWALDRAQNQAPGIGTHCWDAEIARIRAELAGGGPAAGGTPADSYREAIETARRQQAASLELRAALSYAKMLRSSDPRREVRDLLDDVVKRLADGGETVELREARALLRT
jgi:class 3 adenylate cyclase/tetratricopeptide (TPR) repeat protein